MLVRPSLDKYIKVGQINTRYWQVGSEGTPIILIHGAGGFIESWGCNIDALAARNRVYALDLVGFGRSDKPQLNYSTIQLADFVKNFMDVLSIDHAILIGNSTGGAVSLQTAFHHPGRVEKLVLVDSAGFGKKASLTIRLLTVPGLGELLARPNPIGVRYLLREVIFNRERITPELVNLSCEFFTRPGSQQAYLATLRSMGNLSGAKDEFLNPILEQLPHLTIPVLVIWGKQDLQLPVEQAFIAKNKIRTSTLRILENCSHFAQYDKPFEFNEAVIDFLLNS